ncbi:50S ribosomal protein L25/general stress protein Ctc [Bowdeniella nasicola]|uniref:Large ribosomal subunit protein bL25 n=1 Tax=Bowdeniella nasicola TaxID=208480 RepID=A0A1Q5Q1V9_9ACTO|nr:50S ribosomal protein L25/general stress protein Ctc [Bowdeniella nasicola]OKL53570.1 50S ribosomal protein L25/general stress protein Ctc [Bowdeniella nasicola]
MAEKLDAKLRTEFGKGAARRIRREDEIPAVLYAKGDDPIHLTLPGHDTFLVIKDNVNALITVSYDGKKSLALVKDVQRDPVRRIIEHVDLVMVTRDQKVQVDVPVTLVGESAPGTSTFLEMGTLTVTAPVIDIPEVIEISVEGLEDGTVVRFEDITLPEDVEADYEADAPLVVVAIPKVDEADLETPSSEDEEAAEGDEAAEAEGEEAAEGEE